MNEGRRYKRGREGQMIQIKMGSLAVMNEGRMGHWICRRQLTRTSISKIDDHIFILVDTFLKFYISCTISFVQDPKSDTEKNKYRQSELSNL